MLRFGHVPKRERTRAQVRLGTSENSQNERNAMRLVYLDITGKHELPDRFQYCDQPWLYMYRTEIYSEEEYLDYLQRHPTHNLLMTT